LRWDWFQTADGIVISLFVKGRSEDQVAIRGTPPTASSPQRTLSVDIETDGGRLEKTFQLAGEIVSAVIRVAKPKVEVKIAKARPGVQWPALEADGSVEAPVAVATAVPSAPKQKGPPRARNWDQVNWDQIVRDVEDEEGLRESTEAALFSAMHRLAPPQTKVALEALSGKGQLTNSAWEREVEGVIALGQQLFLRSSGTDVARGAEKVGGGPLQVADSALRDGRTDDAAAALLSLLERPPLSPAHVHGVGVARLASGNFCGARDAWRMGTEIFPDDPRLRDEVEAEKVYNKPFEKYSITPRTKADFREIPGKGISRQGEFLGDGVWVSAKPVLSVKECEALIKAAESVASEQGGWRSDRHVHPTTDIAARRIPSAMTVWEKIRDAWVAPGLVALYPETLPKAEMLRVYDAFLAVYSADPGGQRGLERHRDQAELTCVLHLSDPSSYEGGGTHFDSVRDEPVKPPQGCISLFRGLHHRGVPVTAGRRYIFTQFLYADMWAGREDEKKKAWYDKAKEAEKAEEAKKEAEEKKKEAEKKEWAEKKKKEAEERAEIAKHWDGK